MAYQFLAVLLLIKSLERHNDDCKFSPTLQSEPFQVALLTCCPVVTIITEVIVIVTDEILHEYQRAVPLLNE